MKSRYLAYELLECRRMLAVGLEIDVRAEANALAINETERERFDSSQYSGLVDLTAINTASKTYFGGGSVLGVSESDISASWEILISTSDVDAFGVKELVVSGNIEGMASLSPGHTATSSTGEQTAIETTHGSSFSLTYTLDFLDEFPSVGTFIPPAHFLSRTFATTGEFTPEELSNTTFVQGHYSQNESLRVPSSGKVTKTLYYNIGYRGVSGANGAFLVHFEHVISYCDPETIAATYFLDADKTFRPKSNYLAVKGVGIPGGVVAVDTFADGRLLNPIVLSSRLVDVDDEGFWESVIPIPESALGVGVRPIGSDCYADRAELFAVPTHFRHATEQWASTFAGLKTGDVLLTLSNTASATGQTLLHGGEYSHAILYAGADEDGTPIVVESLLGLGVVDNPLEATNVKALKLDVRRLDGLSFEQRQSLANAAFEMVGTPYWGSYEWFSVLASQNAYNTGSLSLQDRAASGLRNLLINPIRMICSGLVWHAYNDGLGVDLSGGISSSYDYLAKVRVVNQEFLDFMESEGAIVFPDTLANSPVLTPLTLLFDSQALAADIPRQQQRVRGYVPPSRSNLSEHRDGYPVKDSGRAVVPNDEALLMLYSREELDETDEDWFDESPNRPSNTRIKSSDKESAAWYVEKEIALSI